MDAEQINHLLTRGVENVYPNVDALRERLASGKALRIYVGVDPTSPHLHIGHAMQFRKLAEFQKLGHQVILLLGSFTAMIGDPSDKSATRKQLTAKEVMDNAATYKSQAGKILRFDGENPVELKFNHEWLGKMSFSDVTELASHFTVQQMMERDMFERRMQEGKPIYIHEFMYPLMQGYDSVAMDVDVELGGNDQTFNMLAGRTLMREMKQKEKIVLTLKLLTNAEGKKMSKSEGGFIAMEDSASEMYGKLMAMDDSMILPYFELATDVPMEEIRGMKIALEQGTNPRDLKARLAHTVVTAYHDAKSADAAAEAFDAVFRNKELPTDIPEIKLAEPVTLIDALVQAEFASSRSNAKTLIGEKAVKVDGIVAPDGDMMIHGTAEGVLVQKGKRFFVKFVA